MISHRKLIFIDLLVCVQDCLKTDKVEIIGSESERYHTSGYRVPSNCCFIHCSKKCAKLNLNDAHDVPEDADASDDDEDNDEDSSVDEEVITTPTKRGRGRPTSGKDSNKANKNNKKRKKKLKKIIIKTATEQRLENCKLKDIKERLLYNQEYRFTSLKEIPAFELRWAQTGSQIKGLLYQVSLYIYVL